MIQQPKEFYAILDLAPDASQDEIKKAYRRLAMRHHPDRNMNDPDSAERLKEINEAYGVLGDPAKRRAYDGIRAFHAQGHPFWSSSFADVDFESILQMFTGRNIETRGPHFCRKRGRGSGRCRRW